MRRHQRSGVLAAAWGVALGVWLTAHAFAQPAAPTLPPLQQCEVERVALQDQVVTLRAQVVALQTQLDRQAIATERERVTPRADGFQWDWASLRFQPVAPTAKTEPK